MSAEKIRLLSSAHQRGLFCEALVAQALKKVGLVLVRHRLKGRFAEVDLLFRSKDRRFYIAVEVKSSTHESFDGFRLTQNQILSQARQWRDWQSRFEGEVAFFVAMVRQGGIQFLDLSDFL